MKFPFRSARFPGWLAFRQRGGELDAAYVERRGARAHVALCETYRTPGDITESLTRLRRQHGWARYRCTLLLGANEYQLHSFEAPKVEAHELKSAARWRVKDLIDYPLDAATVDILDIPAEANARSHSVFAVSARNEVVQRYVRRYQQAGISLEVLDIPEVAQRNISALFEEKNRGLALLAFEDHGGLLTITCGGELFLTRRIDVSLAKLLDGNLETRAQLHERIALEVQRSLDHFDRQFSAITLSRFMLVPLPADTGLAEFLAANIYVRVEQVNVGTMVDCDRIPELADPARQGFALQVLGAALRDEEAHT